MLDELKESWNEKNRNGTCIGTQKVAEILSTHWFQICYCKYQVTDVTIYSFSKYVGYSNLKEMCVPAKIIYFH